MVTLFLKLNNMNKTYELNNYYSWRNFKPDYSGWEGYYKYK